VNGYESCPRGDCQGQIGPEHRYIERWCRRLKGRNVFRLIRFIWIYCETCSRGFVLVEQVGGKLLEEHIYADPRRIAEIRQLLPENWVDRSERDRIKQATELLEQYKLVETPPFKPEIGIA